VATQPVEHLSCLTKEFAFATDNKPTISYWLFQTLTGFTGVLLWVVMVTFGSIGYSIVFLVYFRAPRKCIPDTASVPDGNTYLFLSRRILLLTHILTEQVFRIKQVYY
jgi:hypothetical protein